MKTKKKTTFIQHKLHLFSRRLQIMNFLWQISIFSENTCVNAEFRSKSQLKKVQRRSE